MHTADYFHFWHLRNFTLLFFSGNEKNSAALITLQLVYRQTTNSYCFDDADQNYATARKKNL